MNSLNVFIAANKPESNKPLAILVVRFCFQPTAEDLIWKS